VFICGKEAIREALIANSLDFADRAQLYSLSSLNPTKGTVVHCDSRVSGNPVTTSVGN